MLKESTFIRKKFNKLFICAILGWLVTMLGGMADSVIAGIFLDSDAVAAQIYRIPKNNRNRGHNMAGKWQKVENVPLLDATKRFCSIDIETTGLKSYDEIIEISAIRYENWKEVGRLSTLVKPDTLLKTGGYVSKFITELTGITDRMLSTAPKSKTAISKFQQFVGDDPLLGWNIKFDGRFINEAYKKHLGITLENLCLDAMILGKALYPDMAHHRLCDFTEKYCISNDDAHRSLSDAEATFAVFKRLMIENCGAEAISAVEEKAEPKLNPTEKIAIIVASICLLVGFITIAAILQ